MEELIQRLTENMDIDELAWYLEEKAGKEEVVRALRVLLMLYKNDINEDYPWTQ